MKAEKHAYLIIAHHEFQVLQKLIEALDDHRNDIFVHVDKKVKKIPLLQAQHAKLYFVEDRIDVRWGHVSQIEAEYSLLEASSVSDQNYSRYHLLSGTHMPLKSQDEIHQYFARNRNVEFLNYLYTDSHEITFKLNRYHFFLRNFRNNNNSLEKVTQFAWHVLIKAQTIFGFYKKGPKVDFKANNWVSLTGPAIDYIITQKKRVLKLFRFTFCGDEYFVPFLLNNSNERFDVQDEKNLLFNEFVGSFPRIITAKDYDYLIESDYLFARKFSSSDLDIVNRILKQVKIPTTKITE